MLHGKPEAAFLQLPQTLLELVAKKVRSEVAESLGGA